MVFLPRRKFVWRVYIMAITHIFNSEDKHFQIYFTGKKEGDIRDTGVRDGFLIHNGIDPADLVSAEQIHGTTVVTVEKKDKGKIISATDALIAKTDSSLFPIGLSVRTADCVPIILIDPKNAIIAAVHAGWKGVYDGIVQKVVSACIRLSSDPKSLMVYIGPHIRNCCYSVDAKRAELFSERFGKKYIKEVTVLPYLDLTGIVISELQYTGILAEHIIDCGICTSSCSDAYYSFRKENAESFGEQMALVYAHRIQ
jgi:polyphenol oxidase